MDRLDEHLLEVEAAVRLLDETWQVKSHFSRSDLVIQAEKRLSERETGHQAAGEDDSDRHLEAVGVKFDNEEGVVIGGWLCCLSCCQSEAFSFGLVSQEEVLCRELKRDWTTKPLRLIVVVQSLQDLVVFACVVV